MVRLLRLLRAPVLLLSAGGIFACAADQVWEIKWNEEPTVIRIVGVVVSEGSEASWLNACRRLTAAAIQSDADANWLMHRIDDANYYLVTFGSRAEFRDPNSLVHGFARHDIGDFKEEFAQLRAVQYTVSSDELWEQVPGWSTTSEMNSLTHPGVDQRSYRVDSRHLTAVDSVLTDMANLLNREHYPFPTEGFRAAGRPEVVVHVLTFFGARAEYYAKGQPEAFLAARGKRQEWLGLVARLNAITHDQTRTESRYVHELSYDPWLLEQSATGGG